MAWLVRDEKVLASLDVADDRRSRRKGLLGRDGIEGAILLAPARSVHTIGMRFPIDVAYLDSEMTVVALVTMRRYRIGRPRLRARCVIESEAGRMRRWGIEVGDTLDVKE